MTRELPADVIVFGGGIAGLWMLGRLRAAGYRVLLLESSGLGGVQTIASQGIIHGGTKYALTGKLTDASQSIAAMPGIWRACMEGRGELDLSRVRLLSDHQYLWSSGGLASELAGFFASHLMRSRVAEEAKEGRPLPLRHKDFNGHVYRLEEPVLDVASLTAELARQLGNGCLLAPKVRFLEGTPPTVELEGDDGALLRLRTRHLVLAAGAGNQGLLQSLGRETPVMQRRPLHMLMARGPLPALYAHCLGAGANPRMTITTHPLSDGETIWYLGGQVAEKGVRRSAEEQAAAGARELAELLPWMDLSEVRWAGLRVDRAEPRQPGGLRPDRPFLEERNGVSVAWPTKLAFAPLLADELLQKLEAAGIRPGGAPLERPDWPRPPLAPLPWEAESQWS